MLFHSALSVSTSCFCFFVERAPRCLLLTIVQWTLAPRNGARSVNLPGSVSRRVASVLAVPLALLPTICFSGCAARRLIL